MSARQKKKNSSLQQKTVLITGASSGIGLALARLFAADHHSLILVARDLEKLNQLAADLNNRYNCQVTVIGQDLAQPGGAQAVYASIANRRLDVDILVNNAGAGRSGRVIDADPADNATMVELNITALTELSRIYASAMVKRGDGQILNVASTGAYQPGPYTAVYYAAKAYVRSFSLALANELDGTGVSVSILCPGATATEFSRRAGKADVGGAMSAETVAQAAYRGLKANRRLIIPGLGNQMVIVLSKCLPGHWLAAIVARIQKPLLKAVDSADSTSKRQA